MTYANQTLCRLAGFTALLTLVFGLSTGTGWSRTPDHENTVDVTLTEYQIDMPTSLEPGWTSLRIKNVGKKDHSFKIEGHDSRKKLESELKPGQSATLQIDLRPGTYRVSCPKDDHDDDKNMKLELRLSRF
jgi:uncharacterized cupredoxin-like copper-binding protein